MTDKLSDFDFHLPSGAIAQKPAVPREAARLLFPQAGGFDDLTVADLPRLVRPGDLFIVNNTKVIPAQLSGKKAAGRIGFTLHKKLAPDSWQAFAKPAKKCTPGTLITFDNGLAANVTHKGGDGLVTLCFNRSGDALAQAIELCGVMPLPPYIKRPPGGDEDDRYDYQTVFARHAGAVAAPTAGLHFTDALRQRLEQAGAGFAEVTLHVGAGTFLPVKTETVSEHKMHAEWGTVPDRTVAAINSTRAAGGRVISVGTTSLRILEAAYQTDGHLAAFSGETDIFITPGYKFAVIDMLLTNFHLPRSTLLMLVSAFAGHQLILSAYQHAIDNGYRFFSYGDACLLTCAHNAGNREKRTVT